MTDWELSEDAKRCLAAAKKTLEYRTTPGALLSANTAPVASASIAVLSNDIVNVQFPMRGNTKISDTERQDLRRMIENRLPVEDQLVVGQSWNEVAAQVTGGLLLANDLKNDYRACMKGTPSFTKANATSAAR